MATDSRSMNSLPLQREDHDQLRLSLLDAEVQSLHLWPGVAEKSSAVPVAGKTGSNRAATSGEDDHDLALSLIADELSATSTRRARSH